MTYSNLDWTKFHEIKSPSLQQYYPNTPEYIHAARRSRYFINRYKYDIFKPAFAIILEAFLDFTWTDTYLFPGGPLPFGLRIQHFPGKGYAVWGPYTLDRLSPTTVQHHFWFYWDYLAEYSADPVELPLTKQKITLFRWGRRNWWVCRHRAANWWLSGRPGDPTERQQAYKIITTTRLRYNPNTSTWTPATTPPRPEPRPQRQIPRNKLNNPFHLPKFTDEEFEKKRAEYIQKNGYKVSIPHWDDVIDLSFTPDISDDEYREWRQARRAGREPNIDPEKARHLDNKKRRYETMLASPIPKWHQNIAAVLTALDDAQDALSTATIAGWIAARVAPRAFGAVLGPVGWVLLAADLANVALSLGRLPVTAKRSKRRYREMIHTNPFLKENRIEAAKKLLKGPLRPSRLIEAAQVSEQMFGVGLCLGPIMSLPAAIVSGAVRAAAGEKVTFDFGPLSFTLNAHKAAKQILSAPAALATNPILDYNSRLMIHAATYYSMQVLAANWEGNDPWEAAPRITQLELRAPSPQDPLTRDILKDHDIDPDQTATWPHWNEKWINWNTMTRIYSERITDADSAWVIQNKHRPRGFLANTLRDYENRIMLDALFGHYKPTESLIPEAWYLDQILNDYSYPAPDTDPTRLQNYLETLRDYTWSAGTILDTRSIKNQANRMGIKLTQDYPAAPPKDLEQAWNELMTFYEQYKADRDKFYHFKRLF